jgi:hypothetical protein
MKNDDEEKKKRRKESLHCISIPFNFVFAKEHCRIIKCKIISFTVYIIPLYTHTTESTVYKKSIENLKYLESFLNNAFLLFGKKISVYNVLNFYCFFLGLSTVKFSTLSNIHHFSFVIYYIIFIYF